MPKWAIALSAVLVAGGLAVGYLGLMPRLSDRDRILAVIADAEQAANQGDWGRLLNYVAEDYSDRSGFTKNDLRRLALEAGRSFSSVRVKASLQGLAVSDKGRATALVFVTVWHEHAEGTATNHYSVTVLFVKRGHRWLVANAEGWQEAVDQHVRG